MFAKLLKYEWRATKGFVWLMFLISLSAAVVGGLSLQHLMRVSQTQAQQTLLTVMVLLIFLAAMVALLVCAAANLFFTLWRFYRSRFTQEGYLTFTLPVTTHQILLSSVVNCLLGAFCALVTLAVSYIFMGLVACAGFPGFFSSRWEILEALFQSIGWLFTGENVPLFFQMVAQILISGVCEIPVIMLVITVGAVLAKKHKVVAAVAVYYGIQMAQVLITGAVGTAAGTSLLLLDASASYGWTLTFSTLLTVAVGIASYFLMYYLVKRKLNLS